MSSEICVVEMVEGELELNRAKTGGDVAQEVSASTFANLSKRGQDSVDVSMSPAYPDPETYRHDGPSNYLEKYAGIRSEVSSPASTPSIVLSQTITTPPLRPPERGRFADEKGKRKRTKFDSESDESSISSSSKSHKSNGHGSQESCRKTGFAGWKSASPWCTNLSPVWYSENDTSWSAHHKEPGQSIVFPRRFSEVGVNILNEWWWIDRKGGDSTLGLGGWFGLKAFQKFYLNHTEAKEKVRELEEAASSKKKSKYMFGDLKSVMRPGQPGCTICASPHHLARYCPFCERCGNFGHEEEQCPTYVRHWMLQLEQWGLWKGDVRKGRTCVAVLENWGPM